jgi:hypothetical protein
MTMPARHPYLPAELPHTRPSPSQNRKKNMDRRMDSAEPNNKHDRVKHSPTNEGNTHTHTHTHTPRRSSSSFLPSPLYPYAHFFFWLSSKKTPPTTTTTTTRQILGIKGTIDSFAPVWWRTPFRGGFYFLHQPMILSSLITHHSFFLSSSSSCLPSFLTRKGCCADDDDD